MTRYGGLERAAGRVLEAAPWARSIVKAAYYRLNYLAFREAHFRAATHPAVRLVPVDGWARSVMHRGRALFFGYYDKTPWSPDMQRVIMHRLRDDSRMDILVLDREQAVCREMGLSSAWNYQQGSMAQWLPWSGGQRLIYNDFIDGNLVSVITTLDGERSVLPVPIQVVHPRRTLALSLNYRRLARLRPDYGYAVSARNFDAMQAADRDGLWEVELSTGRHRLLISLASLMELAPTGQSESSEHKVNHAMYSPAGSRFVFLHRWVGRNGRFSRLCIASEDAVDVRPLLNSRKVSHYSWLGEDRLLVWARGDDSRDRYYMIDVATGMRHPVGEGSLDVLGDGHPTFSPDGRWILTDTYPDRARQQHLLLYDVSSGALHELGRFLAPWRFDGSSRCDLHPRWSPDGRMVSIDSAHSGHRMSYVLDLGAVLEGGSDDAQ